MQDTTTLVVPLRDDRLGILLHTLVQTNAREVGSVERIEVEVNDRRISIIVKTTIKVR